jgi:hypothetical protein
MLDYLLERPIKSEGSQVPIDGLLVSLFLADFVFLREELKVWPFFFAHSISLGNYGGQMD